MLLLALLVATADRFYVSNEGSGDVSVIEGSTEIARIPVGTRPRGLKLRGQTLYVAVSGSPRGGPGVDEKDLPPGDHTKDGIAVVDLAQRRVVALLPGGSDPESFDLDRDGKLLFVSNEDASALSVVEIASAKVLHTIAVGAQPEGVTVSPEGTSVYVTSEEDSEIDVVSLPQFALVARIEVDARPRGIVFTRDGKRAFVSCEQGAAVDVIDAVRKVRSGRIAIGGQGVKPMGLALSADGRTLFASTGRGGSVAVIDTASLRVERVIPAVGARPWGIAVSNDGTLLYTANGTSDDVSIVDLQAGRVTARVRAGSLPWGIAVSPQHDRAAAGAQDLGEALVVTATRTPEANAPSKVTVIEGAAIRDSKALDEALRADPSFGLFRRNSSLVADPSSQGVTLRGLGPSGVSRALVLEDGVPLNDGFGGWVYWGAVPRLGIARVEIAPGASSALFGSSAMGGVVEIVSRAIVDRAEAELQGGSFRTGEVALSLGKRGDTLAASLDLEGLGTAGYQVVASPGPVDHAASSRRVSGRARLEARLAPEVSAFVRVGGFGESQDGGTRYTTASAREAEVVAGVTAGSFDLKVFARQARFHQDRARLQPDAFARASEELASSQAAPDDDAGLSLQYASGGLVAGLDARRVFGRSQEALHPAPLSAAAVIARNASGEQQQGGVFVEEVVSPLDWLRLQGALRLDLWRNLGGIRHEQLGSGALRDTDLPDRSDRSLTPRLAARAQALSWLAFRGAVYRSFRAPTLNELYRPFQVGPVRTEANPLLGPETSWGGEAGVDLMSFVHATGFWSTLDNPITNVTTGPNQQQRENLGAARIRGLEVQATWSLSALRLEAGWTLVDARVTSSDLQGRALPQDPRHRLSGSASWTQGGFFAQARARFTSEQFEDDRNQLRLPGYAVVDVTVAQQLAAANRVTLFASLENLLDRRYLAGLPGGVANLGQPFCARIGARFKAF